MKLQGRGAYPRWRAAALSVSVAGLAALAAISLAQAQAGGVGCSRQVKLDTSQPRSEHALTYKLSCNQEIASYTIVSTRLVDSFAPDVAVLGSSGEASNDESFKCEGPIPGDGFRCTGKAKGGSVVSGELSTVDPPCAKKRAGAGKLRLWLVAADKDGRSTEPLRLRGPKCPKKASKSKGKS